MAISDVFTPSQRGPALSDGAGGTSERVSAKEGDPALRNRGHRTTLIVLADEAEYDLSGIAFGKYEVTYTEDEQVMRGNFEVAAKADIVTSALQRASTVLTATVASGAAEGIQIGQWMTVPEGTNATYDGEHQVVTTTATTITFTVADSGSTADEGVVSLSTGARVFTEASETQVLWDAIVIADNQDQNLGAVRAGIYTVISDNHVERIMSDGAAFLQYADQITTAGPLAVTHDEVLDSTSDTVTSLFVSSGEVLLRNGADVATKLTVLFQSLEFSGIDINGFTCMYTRGADTDASPSTLRLKNRSGASRTYSMERVR